MGLDRERMVIVCDLFGCKSEFTVPRGVDLMQAVRAQGWFERSGLYRCSQHPFNDI